MTPGRRQRVRGAFTVWLHGRTSHWSPTVRGLLWSAASGALCGLLGSAGHYCLTRSFHAADISATQSVKFLEPVWAALLGWLIFADLQTQTKLLGGVVICTATLWVARREHRRPALAADAGP